MTFLLKSEVDANAQRTKYEQLEAKVDTLTKLLLPTNSAVCGTGGRLNIVESPHSSPHDLIIPRLSSYQSNTTQNNNPNTHSNTHSNSNTHTAQGPYDPYGGDFSPHSAGDLNSTYMSAYRSYIQADTSTIISTPTMQNNNNNYLSQNYGQNFSQNVPQNVPRGYVMSSGDIKVRQPDVLQNNIYDSFGYNNSNNNHPSATPISAHSTSHTASPYATHSQSHTESVSATASPYTTTPHKPTLPLGKSTSDWLFAYTAPTLSPAQTTSLTPTTTATNTAYTPPSQFSVPSPSPSSATSSSMYQSSMHSHTPVHTSPSHVLTGQSIESMTRRSSVESSSSQSHGYDASGIFNASNIIGNNTTLSRDNGGTNASQISTDTNIDARPQLHRRLFSQSHQFSLPTAGTVLSPTPEHRTQPTQQYDAYGSTDEIVNKNLAQSFYDVDATLNQIEKNNLEIKRRNDNVEMNRRENTEYSSNVMYVRPSAQENVQTEKHSRSYSSSTEIDSPPPPPPSSSRTRPSIPSSQPQVITETHTKGQGQSQGQGHGQGQTGSQSQSTRPTIQMSPGTTFSPTSSQSQSQSSSSYSRPTISSSHSAHPSSHTASSSNSSSSSYMSRDNKSTSRDQEQGSIYSPHATIPLPSAQPRHPYTSTNTNTDNQIIKSLTSGTNKPVYDARYGSFSRK